MPSGVTTYLNYVYSRLILYVGPWGVVMHHRSQHSAFHGFRMVAATSALAPNAAQLAAAPVAWQAPFNLLPAHAVRRKPCSHCCGRLAKPRHALTHCGPHSVTSLRYLAAPHLTAAHHT